MEKKPIFWSRKKSQIGPAAETTTTRRMIRKGILEEGQEREGQEIVCGKKEKQTKSAREMNFLKEGRREAIQRVQKAARLVFKGRALKG